MRIDLANQYGFSSLPASSTGTGEGGEQCSLGPGPGEGGSDITDIRRLAAKIGYGEGGTGTIPVYPPEEPFWVLNTGAEVRME